MPNKPTSIVLRYGENPQQQARFTPKPAGDHWSAEKFVEVAGGEKSFINLTDRDRAVLTMRFVAAALKANSNPRTQHCIAIGVKHGVCCGAAFSTSPLHAIQDMIEGDEDAIFGGCVVLNIHVDEHVANLLLTHTTKPKPVRRVLDMVVAPGFHTRAVEILSRKEGRCRMYANGALAALHQGTLPKEKLVRHIHGGDIEQDPPSFVLNFKRQKVRRVGAAAKQSSKLDLVFAGAICATTTSNTITLVRDGMLLGQGVAQVSRVRAAQVAIYNAQLSGHGEKLLDSVACSDSFFPFPDAAEVLVKAGVRTIFATSTDNKKRDTNIMELCRDQGATFYSLPDKEARMFFGH